MPAKAVLLAATFLGAAAACGAGPSYVNSRAVLLNILATPPGAEASLWVTTDRGKTWQPATARRIAPGALCYQAPADGRYGFYVVLSNQAGTSGPPPVPGTPPQTEVQIDSTPPTVQLHSAEPLSEPGQPCRVRFGLTLIEENLSDGGIRVFYRTDDDWHDGGNAYRIGTVVEWMPDFQPPPTADIRLVVTDRAGNVAADELRGVGLLRLAGASQPGGTAHEQPAEARSAVGESRTPPASGDTRPRLSPIEPQTAVASKTGQAATTGPRTPAVQTSASATPPASPHDRERARVLQQQAARFVIEGQLALAGARLQEALRLVPDDPGLLVDLGMVYYRNRQYDDALRQFNRALFVAPDDVRALENLALVEATQRRYAEARQHLLHLLRLVPDDGRHWLHYGDVEHMMGNVIQARSAWQRVLTLAGSDGELRAKADKRLRMFGATSQPAGPAAK